MSRNFISVSQCDHNC
uniref:Uncharacterized protein n=1 Tax=Anguilla anguilla TaxID=7936 RepID=A0A0E9VA51_ANGAN